jgi:hypothetical protein
MVVRIASFGLMLGGLLLCACDDAPQAPSPRPAPQATTPPTVSPTPPPPAPSPRAGSVIAGSYSLTLTIDSSCSAVPEAERTRKYTASIDNASDGRYVVTLGDARFLSGLICTFGSGRFAMMGCNQFSAGEDIDTASFFLENNNDEAHGGHIVEQTSSGSWMEIIGNASGRLGSSTIEASGTGSVWYCPGSSSYPFPCPNYASCAADLRLTFARK